MPTLLVKGPMVPEIGWRTINGDQRRVRWEGTGFLNTNIKVELTDDGISGFGIPGHYALGTGNLETIDVVYAGYPGIKEAAAFIVEDPVLGARMYAALVPDAGSRPGCRCLFCLSGCGRRRPCQDPPSCADFTVIATEPGWDHLPRPADHADPATACCRGIDGDREWM